MISHSGESVGEKLKITPRLLGVWNCQSLRHWGRAGRGKVSAVLDMVT